jgi:tetratricopeptide (TPR) repeat protein
VSARLCLATTYASQYIPGAPSEENVRYGQIAIDEFRGVLEIDPQNLPAIDGIASILFQMGAEPFDISTFEEAKSYHRRHIKLRPGDPEPYFWIGVIDWTLAFRANGELRARFNEYVGAAGLSDADPLQPDLREQYAKENGATIDEGIDYLKRAIQWRPDYDDAMAYLNLLYRRKADTVVSNVEREELLKMADDLVDKVMEIKTNRSKQTDGTPTSNPDTR